MINVLHIGDKLTMGGATIHGVTKLFSVWLPAFDPAEFNVSLCVLRNKDSGGEYLETFGIQPIYLDKGKFNLSTVFSICQLIKEKNINVLHLHGYGASIFGRLAAIKYGIPVVLHEHMVDLHIPVYQRVADFILSPITSMGIAISDPVSEFMVQKRYVPKNRMKTIVSGISLDELGKSKLSKGEVSVALSAPQGAKIIGIVGRLHEIKGHHYFIEAAHQLITQGENCHFLIVGDGDLRQSLEETSIRLGMTEHIDFLGHCDDMPGIYDRLDALVVASEIEGGPGVLLEALASACVVVSSNTIGLKSEVDGQDFVSFVPAKDSRAIARALTELLQDDEQLFKYQSSAKIFAKKFDVKETVTKLQQCYKGLVGKKVDHINGAGE